MDQLTIENEVENVQLLPAIEDDHGGVVVELKEHMDPAVFLTKLKTSMTQWTLQVLFYPLFFLVFLFLFLCWKIQYIFY